MPHILKRLIYVKRLQKLNLSILEVRWERDKIIKKVICEIECINTREEHQEESTAGRESSSSQIE